MPEFQGDLPNTYSSFLENMRGMDLQILPDNVVREKIGIAQNTSLPEEERLRAKNEIIQSNLRTIPFVIGNGRYNALPEELVGQAFEVLNSCIDNFNPHQVSPQNEEPVKFSTYVINSIEKNLRTTHTVVKTGEGMNYPPQVQNIAGLMGRARELFLQEEEREPNHNEWYFRTLKLAEDKGILPTASKISPNMFAAVEGTKFNPPASIGRDAFRGNLSSETLDPLIGSVDEVISDPTESVEDQVEGKLIKADVAKMLHQLPPRSRTILELRYGIGVNEDGNEIDPVSREEIANMLGISEARVSQILQHSLRILKQNSKNRPMAEYIGGAEFGRPTIEEERYNTASILVADEVVRRFGSREEIVTFLGNLLHQAFKYPDIDLASLIGFSNLSKDPRIKSSFFSAKEDLKKTSRDIVIDILKLINREIEMVNSDPRFYSNTKEKEFLRYKSLVGIRQIPPSELDEERLKQ